jgi:small subunit ribosomal protein S13
MAKQDTAELGDDFSYIIRMADSDVDGLKPVELGLTGITGVGRRTARQICQIADIKPKTLAGHLTDKEQDRLRTAIDAYATEVPWWMVNRQRDLHTNEDAHLFSQEVKLTEKDDISRLAAIKTYRGIRHRSGHKVRGQRLRSNGRSGLTLGVERKK